MNSSAWLDWIRPSSTRHLPYEWVSMISMNWNLVCRVTMVRAMACMCPSTGVVVSKNHLYWSVAISARTARGGGEDRKSTRLNSSHGSKSYADICLKKKNRCIRCEESLASCTSAVYVLQLDDPH